MTLPWVLDRPRPAGPEVDGAAAAAPAPLPAAGPRARWVRWGPLGVVAALVLALSRAWTGGALVTDGPGVALYVRLAMRHLVTHGRIPYLLPELWSGTPAWALAPSLQVLVMVPLGWVLGADPAVKATILATQIVGGWGAYVLARSLWRQLPASVVAGILYALHPMFISHGALAGSEPTVMVMALAPWLVWSLRRGLNGDGGRYLALAGLLAGFGVLNQAEVALGLALLCACMVLIQVGGAGRDPLGPSVRDLAVRFGVATVIGLGVCAFWLLPFAALNKWFVFSPLDLVQGELLHGTSARISREMGVLFRRPPALSGVVSFDRTGLFPQFFYLSWVCVVLSAATLVVLARRDDSDDGTLTSVLLASAVGVWFSAGAIPLASGGPVLRGQFVPFTLVGVVTGLLVAAVLRRVGFAGRRTVMVVVAGAAFVALPYVAPFAELQRFIPVLAGLRFPRFYTVAALGMALGAAYPITLVQDWAEARRPDLASPLAVAASVALIGVFLVDVSPYRGLYRIRPPDTGPAYARATATLEAAPGPFRVATGRIEPSAASPLLEAGLQLSNGWPFPLASNQLWRLTTEAVLSPDLYRLRALGLSGTAFLALEQTTDTGTAKEKIANVNLVPDTLALPLVRAYDTSVVVGSDTITPELAVGLAYRNVGVVTATTAKERSLLTPTAVVEVRSKTPCTDGSVPRLPPALANEFAVACGVNSWLSSALAGTELLNVSPGVGAIMPVLANGLQGVSVFLDRPPGRAELALSEVGADGVTLGPPIVRARAVGSDEYGLTAFTFDPIPDSAGKRYAFVLTCADCPPGQVPRMIASHSVDQPGNLLDTGRLRTDRVAAFVPIFDEVQANPRTSTQVRFTQPAAGRWRVEKTGEQPALVVVASAYFPGWEARVDGKRTPVLQADGAFLGVPVGPGNHLITLEYHKPAAAYAGRAITWATLLALAVVAVRRRGGQRGPLRVAPAVRPRSVPVGPAVRAPRPADPPYSNLPPPRRPHPPPTGKPPSPAPRQAAAPPPVRRPVPPPPAARPRKDDDDWDQVVRWGSEDGRPDPPSPPRPRPPAPPT